MDIKKHLSQDHSKTTTLTIVKYIGSDKKRFKQLVNLFFSNDRILSQRAAWAFSYCVVSNPFFIEPYYNRLIKMLLDNSLHPAIARNILKVLQEVDIPGQYAGQLINICLSNVKSEFKPVAVRAFSITVLSNLCHKYPELKNEVRLILEEISQIPQNPAVKQRTKLALKLIDKIKV